MDEYRRSNLALWNNWTALHAGSAEPGSASGRAGGHAGARSAHYDLAGFKAGASTLQPLELAELGDVAGKSLLHLQCHFGLDTLSWARRGARVTGVDFSDRAIALARSLAAASRFAAGGELGLAARFVHADVYDLPAALHGEFDIVFTSYGVLYWLPDLRRWAEVVAHFLKPGGLFYLVEHHPFAAMLDGTDRAALRVTAPYFRGPEPERVESYGSYAVSSDEFQGLEYGWHHTLGEVVSAVAAAGLRLEYLHEFPYSDFRSLPTMERGEDGWWRLPGENSTAIPLLFSLRATK
jgi:SAM-dependent methyltransferase